jgi:hypothetical protein
MPPPIQVAPRQDATSTGSSATYPAASPWTNRTAPATPSSAARSCAEAMNTELRSTPVPRIPWSRAQVQSISPLPQARSSTVAPVGSRSAAPSVASLLASIGLWMR